MSGPNTSDLDVRREMVAMKSADGEYLYALVRRPATMPMALIREINGDVNPYRIPTSEDVDADPCPCHE